MSDRDDLNRAILRHNRRQRRGRRRGGGFVSPLAGHKFVPRARSSSPGESKFDRVDARHLCPVCHKDSLCLVARDGGTILCGRIANDNPRPNALGELWAHHRGQGSGVRFEPWTAPPANSQSLRATPELCDDAYRALLARLTLWPMDVANLESRGLSAEAIRRGLYRTLPSDGRSAVARAVLDATGIRDFWSIPGFMRSEVGSYLTLAGPPGLLIPVLDAEGRIVALKIRCRTDDGPRYLSFSARHHGGASAEAALHVPARARALLDAGAESLLVTEGELKADVITELRGLPCVSVPGVGAWRLALAAVDRWKPREGVVLAFDNDRFTNPSVQRANEALKAELRAQGVRARCADWDRAHKGLDDHLAARKRAESEVSTTGSESAA